MQHRGHTGQTGRQHGREGGIAAKTGHHLGPETPDDAPGPANGTGHAPGRGKGPQATPQEAAHGQADEVDARRPGQTLFRAVLRAHEQQLHAGMAQAQGFRHGQCREDVPAGAAGGQEDSFHMLPSLPVAVREKFMSRPTQSMVAIRLLPP